MKNKIPDFELVCTGCMACYNICPEKAIQMCENEEGFIFPVIDYEKCRKCCLCGKVCPEARQRSKSDSHELLQRAYYGWHNDENTRKRSSSGGIFSVLAEHILQKRGVVFGAVYDSSDNIVIHKSTEVMELDAMRKSKYAQSYTGGAFCAAKGHLDSGRYVLFSGTPCQIAGLQNYLGSQHEKLITCDFVCHGVPSMRLLNEDLAILARKHKVEIEGFDFRPKIERWSFDYFVLSGTYGPVGIGNRRQIRIPWDFNPYFNAFINNLTLRKCCYNCKYSSSQHNSDFTIADFWGYRNYDKSVFDEKGVSLVLANTEKGDMLARYLQRGHATLDSLDWQYAKYVFKEKNSKSYSLRKREKFFDDYLKFGYKRAVKMHRLEPSLNVKLRRWVGRFLNRYEFTSKTKIHARKTLKKIRYRFYS